MELYNGVLISDKFRFDEIHSFSTAYKENEISTIAEKSDIVIFNSIYQYEKYYKQVRNSNAIPGPRINPYYSEIKNDKVNACSTNSRFGIGPSDLKRLNMYPEYLHFHSMCEQYSDTLERTFIEIDKIYGSYLKYAKTVNIGRGQLFTAPNYNFSHAIECINTFKSNYGISIVLEPCEAILYREAPLISNWVKKTRQY